MAYKHRADHLAYCKQYYIDHKAEIAARKRAKYKPHPKVRKQKATKRPVSALSPQTLSVAVGTCQSCHREQQALAYGFCLACRVLGAT